MAGLESWYMERLPTSKPRLLELQSQSREVSYAEAHIEKETEKVQTQSETQNFCIKLN